MNADKQLVMLVSYGQQGCELLYQLLLKDKRFSGSSGSEVRLLAHLISQMNSVVETPAYSRPLPDLRDKYLEFVNGCINDVTAKDSQIYLEKLSMNHIDMLRPIGAKMIFVEFRNKMNHFAIWKDHFCGNITDYLTKTQKHKEMVNKNDLLLYLEDIVNDPVESANKVCDFLGISPISDDLEITIPSRFHHSKVYLQLDDEEAILTRALCPKIEAPFKEIPPFIVSSHPYSEFSDYSLLHKIEWPNVTKTIKLPYKKASGIISYAKERWYVACYDCIAVLDKDLNLINTLHNKLFSDLHNMVIRGDSIFVTSCTLDSVIHIDLRGNTRNLYSMALCPEYPGESPRIDGDYNKLNKGDSPYWHWHLNDVYVHRDYMFVSCKNVGILHGRTGGTLTVLNRKKGIHDLKLYGNSLYSVSISGEIIVTDICTLKSSNFRLKGLDDRWHRGLLFSGDRLLLAASTKINTNLEPVIHLLRQGCVVETIKTPRPWETTVLHDMKWGYNG